MCDSSRRLRVRRRARSVALEAALQLPDAVAREAAVRLDLRLTGAAGADAGAESLEVGPQPAHAREVVLELRQLDLHVALGRVRVVGEDVEDDRGAVDHGHADRLLEVALLARQQLVVDGDQVRVRLGDGFLQLRELALAEVVVRVGLRAALDELARDGDSGGAQQLLQLGEVVAPVAAASVRGEHRDAERALARTRVDDPCAGGRRVADCFVRPFL